MKKSVCASIFVATLFTYIGSPAATISETTVYDSQRAIELRGEIREGDLKKIIRIARKQIRHGKELFLILDSRGGNVAEAMKIGSFLRQSLIHAVVRGEYLQPASSNQPRHCFSACVLAFIGAASRDHIMDNEYLTRSGDLVWETRNGHLVHKSSPVVGIHRPSYEKEYFSRLSLAEAKQAYSDLDKVTRKYLRDMEAPEAFIEEMFRIPSAEIQLIPRDKFIRLFPYRAAYLDEWLSAKCGALSPRELRDLGAVEGDRIFFEKDDYVPKGMSAEYAQKVIKKGERISDCKQTKLLNHQQRFLSMQTGRRTLGPVETGRASSTLVRDIQAALTSTGYDPGPHDGAMGPRTIDAIREFQRKHALPETGVPTPELLLLIQQN